MARVDFFLEEGTNRPLHQRDQHHPGLHRDQHVSQALGRLGPAFPAAARAPHRARLRAARTGSAVRRKGAADEDPRHRLRRPAHRPGRERPPPHHGPAARVLRPLRPGQRRPRRYFRDLVARTTSGRSSSATRSAWTARRGRGPQKTLVFAAWLETAVSRPIVLPGRAPDDPAGPPTPRRPEAPGRKRKKDCEDQIAAVIILSTYLETVARRRRCSEESLNAALLAAVVLAGCGDRWIFIRDY